MATINLRPLCHQSRKTSRLNILRNQGNAVNPHKQRLCRGPDQTRQDHRLAEPSLLSSIFPPGPCERPYGARPLNLANGLFETMHCRPVTCGALPDPLACM